VSFVFGTNKTSAFGTSNTPTATLPSTPAAGDLLIALVQATTSGTQSSNDGWTNTQSSNGGTGGSTHSNYLWTKVAGAGQTASPTWTLSGSFQWTVVIFALPGPDTVPLDAAGTFANQSTGTPSIAVSAGGRLFVATAFSRATCTWSNEQIEGSTTGVIEAGQATTSAQNAGCMWFIIFPDGTGANSAVSGTATFSAPTIPYMSGASFKEAPAAGLPPGLGPALHMAQPLHHDAALMRF